MIPRRAHARTVPVPASARHGRRRPRLLPQRVRRDRRAAHLRRVREADGPGSAIAHGMLRGAVDLYLGDAGSQDEPFSARGLMVTLLGTAEPTTLRTWFAALSEGGEVLDDLQRRPWGASDGRVRDRYGVEWLIGYEHGSDPSGRAAGSEA